MIKSVREEESKEFQREKGGGGETPDKRQQRQEGRARDER